MEGRFVYALSFIMFVISFFDNIWAEMLRSMALMMSIDPALNMLLERGTGWQTVRG